MSNLVFNPDIKFLDPEKVLFNTGLGTNQTLIDLGAGSGFYTLAAGKLVGEQGSVCSVDILPQALDHIAAIARLKGLRNIKTLQTDLEQIGSCQKLPAGEADVVLFANIVHQIKNKDNLFAEAYRLLKTGGKLAVIDWNDQASLIGPPPADRILEEEIIKLARKAVFKEAGRLKTDQYHYGLMFIK